MSKGCLFTSIIFTSIGAIFFIFIMYLIMTYNSIITLNENVTQSWSQVENQYQRRFDLIPNLVEIVKGVAKFEKETYTAVTEARSKVSQINFSAKDLNDPVRFQQFQQAQSELSGALSKLMVVVEAYPNLKANENFQALQSQLEGTENRIAVERRAFNLAVQNYNIKIKRFPANALANFFGFNERPYFKSDEGSEKSPKIEF